MTRMRGIPLGKQESERLELESAAAQDRPETIAREAVALLNAAGGELWIGIEEQAGRAIRAETIEDAERRRDRLYDFLADTMSPSPTHEELAIEVIDEGRARVLCMRLTPKQSRKPYAFVRSGAWYFDTRVGARRRPLAREEILRRSGESPDDRRGAAGWLRELREVAHRRGEPALWVGFQPTRDLDLDLQQTGLEELVTKPALSGNRAMGWNFTRTMDPPRLSAGRLTWGGEKHSTEYFVRGELRDEEPRLQRSAGGRRDRSPDRVAASLPSLVACWLLGDPSPMPTKTVHVPALDSADCVITLEREVGNLEGVVAVSADAAARRLTVEWTEAGINWPQIRSYLEELGYPPAAGEAGALGSGGEAGDDGRRG